MRRTSARSDGILVAAAALVMVAIIGVIGWTLWHRMFAPPRPPAAVGTAAPPPHVSKNGVSPPLSPEAAFVGPIDDPNRRPRAGASIPRAVKRAAPLISPVKQPEPDGHVAPAERHAPAAAPVPQTTEVTTPPAAISAPVDRPIAAVTYTRDDAEVAPPTRLSPQMLGMLSPSPGVRSDIMTISVLVNERGTVDSVKAVNVPTTIGESVMLTAALSAVKSWHFRPAIKDGAPVRYRQIVPVRIASIP